MAQTAMEPDVVESELPEAGSGVQLFGGTLFRQEDYNTELQGQKGTQIYEKMRRGDPDVASGLAHLIQPILSKNFDFKPAEDTQEERDIADFCSKWILGIGRTDSFAMDKQAFLRHALLCISDGCSAFEKVWGRDRDGRDVYAELVPILPKTIYQFQFSDVPGGGLEYALQRAFILGKGFAEAKVRAEKLALFVFGREGNNLFGWPILRACYKPWLHKEQLEIIDGIRIERNGIGFFVITVPKGSKKAVREAAKAVASQLRVHERQGVIVEEGTKVEILYPTGNDPKTVESINLRQAQIFQVLFSEFMQHGTTSAGSKALVSSKMDFLLMCLQGFATEFCGTVNRQLVVELVYRNWGPRKKYPELQCEDLARMTTAELADFLSKVAPDTVGALGPIEPEMQQHIRAAAHLPAIPEKDMIRLREIHDATMDRKLETAKNPPQLLAPGADPNAPAPKPGDPAAPDPGKLIRIPRAAEYPLELELKPAPLWREPLAHELTANFPMVKAYLMAEPKRLWVTVIEPMRATMARTAAARLVAMSDAEMRKGRVAIPLRDKLAAKLEEPFAAIYAHGRRAVLKELTQQQVAPKAAAVGDGEQDIEPTAKQFNWIRTLAAGFVVGMIKSMEKRGLEEALTVRHAELPAAEQKAKIEDALKELSSNVLQMELGTEVNRAYQMGRQDQAVAMSDQIATCIFSAIMDDGTEKCAEEGGLCAELDGDEFQLGDERYEYPSPFCAWPPNCRCTAIYISREEAA